ncbi:MAG: UDP-N-acetylmuramoyl-L-alanine--D-glutamate ligase [Candidatus Latescibacteria bacterium]|nr:UDP-N-acetylmuramoyl-L-alanine--D-glutamate ligase [Candidatus Latescibacterota bacterium]
MDRDPLAKLRRRTILLAGLGLENKALALYLSQRDIRFSVADSQVLSQTAYDALSWHPQVHRWHLGPDYLNHLSQYDLIVRTPGLPVLHPHLQAAQTRGSQLTSQTQIFWDLCPAPIVGVTGTNGKGTTSSLLAHLLQTGPYRRVFLGGNIGVPPIGFAHQLEDTDLVILELSSFQLQDLDRSPQLALALPVGTDHLDYHRDRAEYVEAKTTIWRRQNPADQLVLAADCPTVSTWTAGRAQAYFFSANTPLEQGAWLTPDQLLLRLGQSPPQRIGQRADIPLRGPHNHTNAAAAALAAALVGASTAQISAALPTFQGLPHRLERVGQYRSVAYYNDSLATSPEAACAALSSFTEPLVLIAGGASKGADFTAMGQAIAKGGVRVLLLLGEEGPRIAEAAKKAGADLEYITTCRDMAQAVAQARQQAQPGEVVLLAPACASFGLFTDYKDRGDQFKQLVRKG